MVPGHKMTRWLHKNSTKVCSNSRVDAERVSRAQNFTLSWNLGICSSYMFTNKQTFQYITTNLNITKSYTQKCSDGVSKMVIDYCLFTKAQSLMYF